MTHALPTRRKTSLTLDAATLDDARALGLNVSAVADAALQRAVAEARRAAWRDANAGVFAAQAAWHETHGHPLSDIMAGPASDAWKD
ncbi:type II toxin-antitoxin system CcdA family antitoxin [Sagittula salina]|uniref:Type II toxin-antitoxin system CcdA family antitoxin n=1 Tax=Sagittula salina TaxID=2820268 RepID=A0A940MS84_9RHOB|nr:type II toxin-antitoxin system CcdA family antitoxin [Sagittula salina]MBP0484449.1 type II toxin-antitoxin system CcdA family antitoxin [Sagittula salina]